MSDVPRGIWERPRGSKIFWIRYTDTEGKRRREKCGSLTNAKQRLALRHAERIRGDIAPAKPIKAHLIGTLIDDAVKYAESENDPYAAKDLGYKLERIRTDWGRTLAKNVTQQDIIDWLEEQSDEHEWRPASRNRYQAAWSLLFRVAVQNKKASENPARGIRRKREDNQRVRYLLPDEEVRLTEEISLRFPPYVPIFQLALHSGMRVSELFRSEVGDFDPRTGLFRVRQRKVREAPPFRYIPVSPILRRAYEALAEKKEVGDTLCNKTEQRDGDYTMKRISYWFNPCVAEAKIKDFLWHDLRHTFASRLVMGGMPIAAVSQYLGHQSLQMTMRYSHLSPETDSKVRDIMMGYYTHLTDKTQRRA